ncbi:aerotaxis receptor Aer [Marinobacterium nitratireducens]|uniref:Aerotaxis receptor Aer n=1 Tax=Marinobacterium nitratireducens TaxID=518897 RepID=A0A917Z5H3_9GAMM|nr:aerotaxis receptor Aer [Marinobacterium nitratireducens]
MTGVECRYGADQRLISTTDLSGRIVYANQAFIDVSGFTAEELRGQHHNIVRHPDMPKEAFADLWNHLKSDRPWMGMVKNRCKNGDHYWVQAYVMPLYDEQGAKTGYQSVRTRPSEAQIERAEKIYAQLRAGKARVPGQPARLALPVVGLIGVVMAATWALLLALPQGWLQYGLLAALTVAAISAGYWLCRPLSAVRGLTTDVYDNPLAQLVMAPRMDECGSVDLAVRMMNARLRTLLGRVEDSITTLGNAVTKTRQALSTTHEGVSRQNSETDLLASAATEMSATAHDIANNTAQTSDASRQASDEAVRGREMVNDMVAAIRSLVDEVVVASESSSRLKEHAEAIGDIVVIISDIAEQTNLLALNAAIEAARAGEQGRGFAVVADEVRTLAKRTQDSTGQIRRTIETIQHHVTGTAETMQRSRTQAENGIERAQNAGQAFERVVEALSEVSDRCIQVASASEEQSAVADEISQNILKIREIAESNVNASDVTDRATGDIEQLVTELRSAVKAFSR